MKKETPLLSKALGQAEPDNKMFDGTINAKYELDEAGIWPKIPFPSLIEDMVKYYDNGIIIPECAISVTVLGEPTSQKRHRSVKMGNFTRQYDPSSADKADFLSLLREKAPETPFNTPLRLELAFYFSRPKSHYGTGKNLSFLKPFAPLRHTSKPDIDNCIKFVQDALNKVYWRDDSLICELSIKKLYDVKPRTEIKVFVL